MVPSGFQMYTRAAEISGPSGFLPVFANRSGFPQAVQFFPFFSKRFHQAPGLQVQAHGDRVPGNGSFKTGKVFADEGPDIRSEFGKGFTLTAPEALQDGFPERLINSTVDPELAPRAGVRGGGFGWKN